MTSNSSANQGVNAAGATFGIGCLTDNLTNILTPAGLSNTNPAYVTDYVPVLFGPSYSPYVNERLPDDFAIYFPFTATQFAYGSRVVITAGTEEWEVLQFANNSFDTAPNPLLLARVV